MELLGTVGNLTVAGLGLDELAADYSLLPFLSDLLHPGEVEDDVMLEVSTGRLTLRFANVITFEKDGGLGDPMRACGYIQYH